MERFTSIDKKTLSTTHAHLVHRPLLVDDSYKSLLRGMMRLRTHLERYIISSLHPHGTVTRQRQTVASDAWRT
jgi:hypothetical protein